MLSIITVSNILDSLLLSQKLNGRVSEREREHLM